MDVLNFASLTNMTTKYSKPFYLMPRKIEAKGANFVAPTKDFFSAVTAELVESLITTWQKRRNKINIFIKFSNSFMKEKQEFFTEVLFYLIWKPIFFYQQCLYNITWIRCLFPLVLSFPLAELMPFNCGYGLFALRGGSNFGTVMEICLYPSGGSPPPTKNQYVMKSMPASQI